MTLTDTIIDGIAFLFLLGVACALAHAAAWALGRVRVGR